ncbi:hypothetical protein [Amycolatopsis sp. NPDC051071]|uniref:hypothetical protein n=1 Tax=Amycolatopsis sp. NPDC051071 TaxID=3154637 RepID=UPI0034200B61
MIAYIRRFPALVLTLVGALVGLLVHLVPGLPDGAVLDVAAAAVSLIAGVEIHRRVTAVPVDQRGLSSHGYEFEDIAPGPETSPTD